MVNEIRYTTIHRVLDSLTDHPMLRDLSLEQVVRYTIRFIAKHGYNNLYQDQTAIVPIEQFRGLLPCELIRIIQVKDTKTGLCMRSMTDSFGQPTPNLSLKGRELGQVEEGTGEVVKPWYIPPMDCHCGELAFKTQGRCIYTTFPEGAVEIAFKALPVDDEGYPLIIDNEVYLAALEAYIKRQIFTIKFDTGKIAHSVLQNAKQEYAWASGQLMEEMQTPSISEFEAISRGLNHLIPRMREFDKGFKTLGDREYLRRH